jgi:hypothetical protein
MPQVLREHKNIVEINIPSIKRKYHLGGGGLFSTSNILPQNQFHI